MSEYGIIIKNSAGDAIVDSKYKNFAIYESGSATVNGVTTITFATPTTKTPIITIKPDTVFISFVTYTKSGDNWTGFKLFSESSTTIYWKSYISHQADLGGSYGLVAYNNLGEIVFDSNRSYLSISSVVTGIALSNPDFGGGGGTETITHTEIENPYYMWSPERYSAFSENLPPIYHRIFITGIKKINSTSALLGWQFVTQGSGGLVYYNSLIQDVVVLA